MEQNKHVEHSQAVHYLDDKMLTILKELKQLLESVKELKYKVYNQIDSILDYLEEQQYADEDDREEPWTEEDAKPLLLAISSMRKNIETVTQEFNSIF